MGHLRQDGQYLRQDEGFLKLPREILRSWQDHREQTVDTIVRLERDSTEAE